MAGPVLCCPWAAVTLPVMQQSQEPHLEPGGFPVWWLALWWARCTRAPQRRFCGECQTLKICRSARLDLECLSCSQGRSLTSGQGFVAFCLPRGPWRWLLSPTTQCPLLVRPGGCWGRTQPLLLAVRNPAQPALFALSWTLCHAVSTARLVFLKQYHHFSVPIKALQSCLPAFYI